MCCGGQRSGRGSSPLEASWRETGRRGGSLTWQEAGREVRRSRGPPRPDGCRCLTEGRIKRRRRRSRGGAHQLCCLLGPSDASGRGGTWTCSGSPELHTSAFISGASVERETRKSGSCRAGVEAKPAHNTQDLYRGRLLLNARGRRVRQRSHSVIKNKQAHSDVN